MPTSVNEQITDAIVESAPPDSGRAHRVPVGSVSAVSIGMALQAMAQAAGLGMLNAGQSYQQWATALRATTLASATTLLVAADTGLEAAAHEATEADGADGADEADEAGE